MMYLHFLLSALRIFRGKGIILLIILGVACYFGYVKYGDKIKKNYPQVSKVKEKINAIKNDYLN